METEATLFATMPSETLGRILALALGALTVAGVWRLRRLTPGTTLVAPWAWALGAVVGLTVVAVSAADGIPHYLAGTLLLAPPMALLGAKRPQDRAWQWIVLSLLALAWLPAGQQWLYRPGGELSLDPAWQWFLLAISVVGVLNHLLTSRGPSAALYGVGLYCWLGTQFPAWTRWEMPQRELAGLAALAVAAWWASRSQNRSTLPPPDRLWRDFRDAFGTAWALRVAELFNSASRQAGWGVSLGWSGFEYADSVSELPPPARQCLDNLLRRFVSPEWIQAQLQHTTDSAHTP